MQTTFRVLIIHARLHIVYHQSNHHLLTRNVERHIFEKLQRQRQQQQEEEEYM